MIGDKINRSTRILFLMLLIGIANICRAATYDDPYNGLNYSVDTTTKTATCTGLNGGGKGRGNLVIPDYIEYDGEQYSVTEIGRSAFGGCTGFTGSLTIPNSVTTIGDYAFWKCSGFYGSLTIPDSVTTIGDHAFSQCSGFNRSLTIGNSVTTIGDYAFFECSGFTGLLTIPNSVIEIGESAFSGCFRFTGSLTIPESVTTIGNGAFLDCTGFTGSLTIGDSVTTIGGWAFQYCSGFTGSLTIPNSVIEIGESAFICCSGFNGTLSLGESVSSIRGYAFNNTNFTKVDSYNPNPPKCGDMAFSPYPEQLYVPAGSIDLYKAAAVWRNFSYIGWLEGTEIEAQSITLNTYTLELTIESTSKLTATVTPTNTTDQTIVWESDNEKVATVDNDGTVNALAVGTANITAACGNVSATCNVTVNPVVAASVTLNKESMTLTKGEEGKLTAKVYPEDTTDPNIVWKSDNEKVATVDNDGMVTAVNVGTANITATCGNASATCKVTVNPVVAASVTLNKETMTLTKGEEGKLTAKVYPEDTTDPAIVWKSDNEKVATVANDGMVTALAVGTANITATCGNVSATCKVTVNPVVASSVTLNKESMTLTKGEEGKLTAKVYPEDTTDPAIVWESDNEKVATVTADGTVTAVDVGTANITASCGNASATCKVTVNPVVAASVTLNKETMTLTMGEKEKLNAKVYPEDTTYQTIVWESDNEKVAIVAADGTVTAVDVGTANITASCGDASATCMVTVKAPEPIGIRLSPLTMTLQEGETGQFEVTFSPNNAESNLTWNSSDPSIVEVNNNGVVEAIKPGMVVISVTSDNGVTGMATVRVVDNSVAAFNITPDNLTLDLDESVQLSAQVSPEAAVSEISWSSRDPEVASVDENGLVTAVGKGVTVIYARADNGVTGIATVTVMNSHEVASVTIVPGNLEMLEGSERQLEVIVEPGTASPQITWLSLDPAVAEVGDNGLLRALSPGVTVIYALCENGMTGLATVKVVSNEVTSVTIDPDLIALEIDETGQFRAVIEPFGADAELTWTSSDPTIATVDNDGVVKGKGQGYAFIYATAPNGVTGIAIAKVTDPNAGDNPDFGYGDNGVYVSAVRIREGDSLGLFAERPTGYENNDWRYEWYLNGSLEAEGKYVIVTAGKESGWTGNSKTVDTESYEAQISNLAGDLLLLELPKVSVYSRPLTPEQLVRKGDGASHSFIAMSSIPDSELARLGYSFYFGYTDAEGVNRVIYNGTSRYCHTSQDIYSHTGYRFWVYTAWTFPDGATITSGLRYLDGGLDESFDRSDFNFSSRGTMETIEGDYEISIYTIEGHSVGNDLDRLAPGLYIIRERNGNQVTSRKIIVK